jgi:hypothetical protein
MKLRYSFVLTGWHVLDLDYKPKYHKIGGSGDEITLAVAAQTGARLGFRVAVLEVVMIGLTRVYWQIAFIDPVDDVRAGDIAHALAVLHGALTGVPLEDGITPMRLTRAVTSARHRIAEKTLVRALDPKISEWDRQTLLGSAQSAARSDEVWRYLPAAMVGLVPALSFLDSSYRTWRAIRDASNEPITAPIAAARAESAFQDAYKAIEAVVGEPGKLKRFLRRLTANTGLTGDELVGLDDKRTLLEHVHEVQAFRDRHAAHGGSLRTRRLTEHIILEAQECARAILYNGLRMRMDGSGPTTPPVEE